MIRPVVAHVYADYACPWSFIVAGRLEQLRRERPLTAVRRPLPLFPDRPPAGPLLASLATDAAGAAKLRLELQRMAADLGRTLNPPAFVPDTTPALLAGEFARDLGAEAFAILDRRLFDAYFVDGRDIGDRGTLLEIVREADLDAEAAAAALDDGRYEDVLVETASEAERYAIDRIPTCLFGRHRVVGAAPLRVLREAAERAATDLSSAAAPPSRGGSG